MNQLATQQERLPMDSVGIATGSAGSKIAPQNLAEVVKFAEVMCRADIALPKHLRGNAGACMAVALQALDWQMNPFAVASKSYSVNGQIAYEAQLIVAVVNTRSGIEGRIRYRFEGEGADRVCIASGKLDGEELEVRSPRFKDITPKNSPLWKSDPDQQHCYYTGRSWARRFTPEVILGIYDREEVEELRGPEKAKDITDRVIVDPLSDEPISAPAAQLVYDEDFDRSTGEIIDTNSNPDEDAPSSSSVDAGESPSPATEAGDTVPQSPASNLSRVDRSLLIECAAKFFDITVRKDLDAVGRQKALEAAKDAWKQEVRVELHPKLASLFRTANSIITGKNQNREGAIIEAANWLECEPSEIGGAA